MLPSPGIYACDYGEQYAPRNVQVVTVRLVGGLGGTPTGARPPALRLWHSPNRELLHLTSERPERLGEHALVATKVIGDRHVPAGATAFFVPLVGAEGGPVRPEWAAADGAEGNNMVDTASSGGRHELVAWTAFGCEAMPGFRMPCYRQGRLRKLNHNKFVFEWRSGNGAENVYHRLQTWPDCDLGSLAAFGSAADAS